MKSPDIIIDKLIRSKRKTIGLQITRDATLIVRAPRWARRDEIDRLVIKHKDWIYKKKAEMLRDLKSLPIRNFTEGEQFLYLGQSYPLHITDNRRIILFYDNAFYLSEKYRTAAKQAFSKWYKLQAKRVIPHRVQLYAAKANLRYGRVAITNANKRWGSCSHRGNLNFSWRLVMAPLDAVDYVIAHELAHIEVKDHSKRFWDKVEAIYPGYEKHRAWLRTNEHSLTL